MSVGIGDIALIVSATAMVALAYLTYRSVRLTETGIIQRNRPYLNISKVALTLQARQGPGGEERLVFTYYVRNHGHSLGIIDGHTVLMNGESPNDEVEDLPDLAMFPGQEMPITRAFRRSDVFREHNKFTVQIEIDYHDDVTGDKYYRRLDQLLIGEPQENRDFRIVRKNIEKSETKRPSMVTEDQSAP